MTRSRLVISVSVLVLTIVASPALAEDQTAPDSTATVTVQGKRNEVTDRIDRRIYDIKSDPAAQSGNAGEVLNKLPSVTVTPAGRVALRGDTNVTVLIDGKYPVNGNNFTQTLAATDIDRIEVITNPSAKYKPDGTFMSGRATRNMDRFPIRRAGDQIFVDVTKVYHSDIHPTEWAAATITL